MMGGQGTGFEFKEVMRRDNVSNGYYTVVEWSVKVMNTRITGESASVRAAYRHACKAVRRYMRMWHFLNPAK